MIEIRIDVDEQKAKVAPQMERDDFLTQMFCAMSAAIADYDASVDISDPLHWVIQVPERNESKVRRLLNG